MRKMVPAALAGALAVVMASAVSPATAAPAPELDYSMPDQIGPVYSVLPANGAVPEYDFTGKYVPQTPLSVVNSDYGATNYGEVPADGRYQVNLDACASTVAASPIYEWTIAGIRKATEQCKTTMRLPEGDLEYTLQIIDSSGSATITGKLTVKNVLIAIMGDSYSSGEGWPPFRESGGDSVIAWDDPTCHRSRWSGFVRAATEMEAADSRSNVTVLDVACSGGTVPSGVLGPQNGRPAQVRQVNTLRNEQPIDQVFLSIGGNDIGFADVIAACELSGPTGCANAQKGPTDAALAALPARYAKTAACLNNGDCMITVGGSDVAEPALKVPGSGVIQAVYPNLAAGPVRPDGYPADTNPDALCNVNWAGAPFLYGDSFWGVNVVFNGTKGTSYTIPIWRRPGSKQPGVPQNPAQNVDFTPTADGIAVQIMGNAGAYGWTATKQVFDESTSAPGGLCAYPQVSGGKDLPVPAGQQATRVVYPTNLLLGKYEGAPNSSGVVHPNERGQDLYRRALVGKAIAVAKLPVAGPTVNPTPTPIPTPTPEVLNAPTGLKLANLKKATKKHRHVRISFTAPDGLKPTGYKVRVKAPDYSAQTIRDSLKSTSTVWKKGPKGVKVKVRVGSYTSSPQALVWGAWKTLKVQK